MLASHLLILLSEYVAAQHVPLWVLVRMIRQHPTRTAHGERIPEPEGDFFASKGARLQVQRLHTPGRFGQSASTSTGLVDRARFAPPPSGAVVATRACQRSLRDGPTGTDAAMMHQMTR